MFPTVYDDRACQLGEGPLWHPGREQLFWFDILAGKLLSRDGTGQQEWQFDRQVSAAGWIDDDTLLIAGETGLSRFSLSTGKEVMLCEVEADRPDTRSNDGRADPWGGFWFGTMDKAGQHGKGNLYRWYDGELHCLRSHMGTPNALCFDRARNRAYFADTKERCIRHVGLDAETGWPQAQGEDSVFVDLTAGPERGEHKPDGAVIDARGCLWSAQWGSARVACYAPDGNLLETISFPTGHTSCPAFGGPGLNTLFVTTAQQNLPTGVAGWTDLAGQVLCTETPWQGVTEPRVQVN